jgi:hypothetical protein
MSYNQIYFPVKATVVKLKKLTKTTKKACQVIILQRPNRKSGGEKSPVKLTAKGSGYIPADLQAKKV